MDNPLTKAIIFDLDGTLIDSKLSIYECFLKITYKLAPDRAYYAEKAIIGPPLKTTASEILGSKHKDKLNRFIELFIQMHDERIIYNTKPYEGVDDILRLMYEKKIPLAIATNKREIPTLKLMEFFKWNDYFNIILCSDSNKIFRTKDEMIKNIISENQAYANCYFIGDTISDYQAAVKNDLDFILANYGYESKENIKNIKNIKNINSFREIIDTLNLI